MDLKKLTSLIASAAVAVSCAAGTLSFGASAAYSRYMLHYVDNDTPGQEIDTYLSLTDLYSNSSYKAYFPYISTYGTENLEMNTVFTSSDLRTFLYNDLSFYFQINDGGFVYTTELKSSDITSVPENGINLALQFSGLTSASSYGGKPSFNIRSASASHNLGGVALTYKFSFKNWYTVLDAYGIPEGSDVFYYYDDDPTTFYKMTSDTDALFTLTKNQIITFVYDADVEFFGPKGTVRTIKKAVLDMIGVPYTLDELGGAVVTSIEPTVEAYVDKTVDYISGKVYTYDTEAVKRAYITGSAIEQSIKDYFDGRDASGSLTAEARSHLEEYASVILQSTDNNSVLEDAIYAKFGVETTPKAAAQLMEAIKPTVIEKLISQIIATNAKPADYSTNIRYFLSSYAVNETDTLKTKLDAVRAVYTGASGTALTVSDILNSVNAVSTNLVDVNGNKYKLADILQKLYDLKTGTYASTNLSLSDALAQVAVDMSRSSQTYQNTAPAGTTTTTTTTTVTTPSYGTFTTTQPDTSTGTNYIQSTDTSEYTKRNYVDSQDQYLQQQIDRLTSLVEGLQNDVTALKAAYSQLPYSQNLYDWAANNNVNTDAFISQVAEAVAGKLGSTGSGMSAYEIAVRNGFTGTEQEWLNSLVGKSAYEIAVKNGYTGTEQEWLASLKGSGDGSEKVIYVYGSKSASAGPTKEDLTAESVDLAYAGSGDDDDAFISSGSQYYGTVTGNDANIGSSAQPTAAANVAKTAAAGNVTTTSVGNRSANPATGIAVGVVIPAAAGAALLLSKKDKRKRGRK